MKTSVKFCLVAASFLMGPIALAQSQVTSTLLAQRVELVDGKTVLKPAVQSKPGDVIDYSNTVQNAGKSAADKVTAVVPVPAGTTLVSGSALPAQAQASVDGTVFAAMPLMRTVRQLDGSQRSEPVPLADYRAVRWELGALPAGRSAVVSLRVRVDAPAVAAAAVAAPAAKIASKP